MPLSCRKCSREVPIEARHCPFCTFDAGYPNVRLAERDEETQALTGRLDQAKASAAVHGTVPILEAFATAVASSDAVMNRQLGLLNSWLNGDNPNYLTFHQQVRAGIRTTEDNVWDQQRISAENTVNPLFYESINFAALSLDATGSTYYGRCSIILRVEYIEERSTVFEENPFTFCRHHGIISGQPAPFGYRATWPNRGQLAAAKLGAKIVAGTTEAEFPSLLMEPRRDQPDCDFVEVHIYGPIHKAAIKHVSCSTPTERADMLLWRQAKRKLKELDASSTEV